MFATNRDLRAMVEAGKFREDLYYRIAHYIVSLPPVSELFERRQLVETFWSQLAPGHEPLPDAILEQLADYDWPGNFRELFATLRAMAALHSPGEPLTLAALPHSLRHAPATRSRPDGDLRSLTDAAMRRAVEQHNGNFSAAARSLSIDRSTLYRRLILKPGAARN